MEILKKDMERNNWLRWRRCRDAYLLVDEPGFSGMVGLKQLLEVASPLVVTFGGEPVTVSGDGFYWLQMAPKGGHWWLTVMYDQDEQPRQAYFDITGENHILPEQKSWFTDLFLDVVMMPDGRTKLLDAEELEQALREGVVTQAQYDNAAAQAQTLLAELSANSARFFPWAAAYFQRLKPMLR